MKVVFLEGIEGAREARGLVVVVDVFRAFSLAPLLASLKPKNLLAVSTTELATSIRENSDEPCILVGEVQGKKPKGFDFGNSPSEISAKLSKNRGHFEGKTIVHRSSNGTQGLLAATTSSSTSPSSSPSNFERGETTERVLTGSFVNISQRRFAGAECSRVECHQCDQHN